MIGISMKEAELTAALDACLLTDAELYGDSGAAAANGTDELDVSTLAAAWDGLEDPFFSWPTAADMLGAYAEDDDDDEDDDEDDEEGGGACAEHGHSHAHGHGHSHGHAH